MASRDARLLFESICVLLWTLVTSETRGIYQGLVSPGQRVGHVLALGPPPLPSDGSNLTVERSAPAVTASITPGSASQADQRNSLVPTDGRENARCLPAETLPLKATRRIHHRTRSPLSRCSEQLRAGGKNSLLETRGLRRLTHRSLHLARQLAKRMAEQEEEPRGAGEEPRGRAKTRLRRFHPLTLARAGPCAPWPLRTRTCPSMIQRPTRAADRGTLRTLALGLIRGQGLRPHQSHSRGAWLSQCNGGLGKRKKQLGEEEDRRGAAGSAPTAANPTGIVCRCEEDYICGACKGKGKEETSPRPTSEAGTSRTASRPSTVVTHGGDTPGKIPSIGPRSSRTVRPKASADSHVSVDPETDTSSGSGDPPQTRARPDSGTGTSASEPAPKKVMFSRLAERMAAAAKEGQQATGSEATTANPRGKPEVCCLCRREGHIQADCKGKGKRVTSPCPNSEPGSRSPATMALQNANRDCSTVPRVSQPATKRTYSKGPSKPFGTGPGWEKHGKPTVPR
ncbi:hypothetical protein JB92DRAFT_1305634 [Gautieria morchelliformis]|nr:hypothetical protein JB92DRAFT_1305634 [Gautieria morchelliformis]